MNRNELSLFMPVLLADLAGLAGLYLWWPALAQRLAEPNGRNALLVSTVFILFCVGVFVLRKLRPSPNGVEQWLPRGWAIGLAVIFALTISLTIAWQLGFFASGALVDTRELGEGGSAVYFVFGPGAWLGFSLLYTLVFAFQVSPSILYERPGYSVWAFLGLLAGSAMLVILAAQAGVLSHSWAWAAATFVWLLVLFGPPRLIYATRTVGLDSRLGRVMVAELLAPVALGALLVVQG